MLLQAPGEEAKKWGRNVVMIAAWLDVLSFVRSLSLSTVRLSRCALRVALHRRRPVGGSVRPLAAGTAPGDARCAPNGTGRPERKVIPRLEEKSVIVGALSPPVKRDARPSPVHAGPCVTSVQGQRPLRRLGGSVPQAGGVQAGSPRLGTEGADTAAAVSQKRGVTASARHLSRRTPSSSCHWQGGPPLQPFLKPRCRSLQSV